MQVFFSLSGFLNAVVLFRRLDTGAAKSAKVNYLRIWTISVIGRFVRFIPVMMLVALFHATWLHRVGDGPFWNKVVFTERQACRTNMWRNLLLINNYSVGELKCIVSSWYLAADFHLSAIGTGLLLIVFR